VGEQRFIAYYRVSTDRQGRSGLGLDAQRETVSQFIAGRAASVIAEFVEIESGSKSDRPKLREALDACQREKATLLIAKLDRLARSVAFISALMEAKTNFLAVDMPHASRLVLHVMAAFAEHEREMIRERTKAALVAARARGVKLGTHGQILAARHRDEATAYALQIGEPVRSAIAGGARTTREIAQRLNDEGLPSRQGGRWHPASVARVLRRLQSTLVPRPPERAAKATKAAIDEPVATVPNSCTRL
jgi:DNA invertase Pin-like site-specific DNA recombinase